MMPNRALLFVVFFCALPTLGRADLPDFLKGHPEEEHLKHGATHTGDGFYVRVDSSVYLYKPSTMPTDTVFFKVTVPCKTEKGINNGKGNLLWILDWRGQTISSVRLPSFQENKHPDERSVEVSAVRRLAKRMVLTFTYETGGEFSAITKFYVVPLRDHLPTTR